MVLCVSLMWNFIIDIFIRDCCFGLDKTMSLVVSKVRMKIYKWISRGSAKNIDSPMSCTLVNLYEMLEIVKYQYITRFSLKVF